MLAATKTTSRKDNENRYPVYSSQTKDNGLMGYFSEYLYENAITWTTDGANAGTVNFRGGKFYCTNVCGVLLSDSGYANKMIAEALNRIAWRHVSKVGNPKLMNNVMSEIVLQLPLNFSEQKKISAILQTIDRLITLHQCKPFFRHTAKGTETVRAAFSWEQRKLSDAVDICSGCDYKNLSAGPIPVYGTGGYMLSVDKALSYSDDAVGIGRKGTIDKPYILRAPFWTVDTLFYAVPRTKYDLQFLFGIFQKVDWKKKDESTGVPSLSKQTINTVDIAVPENLEQQKIGLFFQSIDQLVTLHQRNDFFVKAPKNLEISLQKTVAWEQRKLEDVFQKIRNAFVGTATPFYVKDGHFYLESNNVKDGEINRNSEVFINDEFYEKQRDNWLHTGDIVMVQSGHVGHSAVIPDSLNDTAAHALIIIANPKQKICPHFINVQFMSPNAKKSIGNITTGNTIKHILASDMKVFEILLPSYAEQIRIGQFFKSLNRLITLHQRERLFLILEEILC